MKLEIRLGILALAAVVGEGVSLAKQPIHGLVSMGSLGFNNSAGKLPNNSMEEINAHPGIYSAAVVNLLWSQLEPQRGVFDDSALTGALAAIAAYNAKYPATPVAAKLRVNAGIGTPAWVTQLTGGPITVADNAGPIQVGAFWSGTYRAEWRGLQAHLAAEYDASPLIAEVGISSCSSRTDEPFIISLDSTSLANMRQFGFSDSAYMGCLSTAWDDYAAWANTPLDYSFNSYRDSDGCTPSHATNCLVEDPAFTTRVMQAFRAALGTSKGVVGNHGLQDPLSPAALPVYAEFQSLSGQAMAGTPPVVSPLEFQTYSQMVSWDATIQLGLTYHPTEIEIWDTVAAGGLANLSAAQLQSYAAGLLSATMPASNAALVSAANPRPGPVAPGSLVSIFGSVLSAGGQTVISVTDSSGTPQQAAALYISPTQVNAVLPAAMANGAAAFTVSPPGAPPVSGGFTLATVAPGIFSADATGAGVAAAFLVSVHADGSTSSSAAFTCSPTCAPNPIDASEPGGTVYLILFGTGFRNRTSLANMSVKLGTQSVVPVYAGAQSEFQGLDQLNVAIPSTLAGAGAIPVQISADGALSNIVTIQIK